MTIDKHGDIEIFKAEWKGRHLLYEPLSGTSLLAGDSTRPIGDVAEWFEKECYGSGPTSMEVNECANAYKPQRVTILPTGNCNLRCKYCYASGGDSELNMPWWMAKWGIDLVVENTLEKGGDTFDVYFHGGGEPTTAWGLVEECLRYAKQRGRAAGLNARFGIATNGVFNSKVLHSIEENFQLVSVAIDGPRHVHNICRVKKDGGEAFDPVFDTIKKLDIDGFKNYALVTTITDVTIDYLEETLQFFKDNIKCNEVHIGPAVPAGRFIECDLRVPGYKRSVSILKRAFELAWELGITMSFPGTDPEDMVTSYCNISSSNLYLTYEGYISRCLEVCNSTHPLFDKFVVGRLKDGEAIFFNERMDLLGRRNLSTLDHCGGCIIKYHCAGDCPARIVDIEDYVTGATQEWRCQLKRDLFICRLGVALEKRGSCVGDKYPYARYEVCSEETGLYNIGEALAGDAEEGQFVLARVKRSYETDGIRSKSLFADAVSTCPGG